MHTTPSESMKIIKNPKGYYDQECGHCVPRDMHKPIIRIESKYLTLVNCDGIYCSYHTQELIRELEQKIIAIQQAVNTISKPKKEAPLPPPDIEPLLKYV